MALDGEEKVGTAAGALDVDAEAFINFFKQECVGLGGTEDVAVETMGTLRDFVFNRIEESFVVGGPGGAGDACGSERDKGVGSEVFDLERVLAETRDVGGVSEESVVVANVEDIESEKGVAFGEGRPEPKWSRYSSISRGRARRTWPKVRGRKEVRSAL